MLSTEMDQLGFPPLEFEMATYRTICTNNFCHYTRFLSDTKNTNKKRTRFGHGLQPIVPSLRLQSVASILYYSNLGL